MLLQQRILAVKGDGVEVHIKRHPVAQPQLLHRVKPARHERGVGLRGDAAAVLGQERALRWHIEPGKQGQPLVEHRTHHVTVPSFAKEF